MPVESSFFSIAAEIQRARTRTTPAVMAPSKTLRSVICELPTFQCTSSIASRTIGEKPVTQRTTAIQASHEMLRSTMRTQRTPGNVRRSTRALSRMTTSESRIGIATLNTAGLTSGARPIRAA